MTSRPSARASHRSLHFLAGCVTALLGVVQVVGCNGPSGSEDDLSRWCPPTPGVESVRSAAGPQVDSTVSLHPLWQVDGGAVGWEIDAPRAVAVDPHSGRIAIADHLHRRVIVLSADGQRLYQWPADSFPADRLSVPGALEWDSAGRVSVLDNVLWRISVIDSNGLLIGQQALKGNRLGEFEDVWLQNGEVFGRSALGSPATDTSFAATMAILRTRDTGRALETILEARVPLVRSTRTEPIPIPGAAIPTVAAIGDSFLVIGGDIAELRLHVFGASGIKIRQICRVVLPVLASRAESLRAVEIGALAPSVDAARIGRIFVGADQRIWVQRTRGNGELLQDRWFGPQGSRFDIFDQQGKFQMSVQAPGHDRIVGASDRLVISFHYSAAGAVSVVGYTYGK